jgi:hypothetical protein
MQYKAQRITLVLRCARDTQFYGPS